MEAAPTQWVQPQKSASAPKRNQPNRFIKVVLMIVLLLVQVSFLSALPMHTPSASPSTFPLLLTALFGSLSNARASTLTCANRLLTEVKPLGPRWEVITYIEGAGMAQSGAVLILA